MFFFKLFILLNLLAGMSLSADSVPVQSNCHARTVDNDTTRLVCYCDQDICETLNFKWPEHSGETVLVKSTRSGSRFESFDESNDTDTSRRQGRAKIRIDLTKSYQTILGWGGAITDAAAINILSLPEELSDKLIESYYGPHGLDYNFLRVPIGGSDFSPVAYSYDDTPEEDFSLRNWTLSEYDTDYKIPCIKKALTAAQKSDTEVKLFGSPWSPPKWMKTNNNFARGYLIDEDRVYKSYAEYLMKFFDSYENLGVRFWGATVQNEPKAAYLPFYSFNSLQFKSKIMAKFIAKYLGPALESRGKSKENFKLMVGDDSLYFVDFLFPSLLESPEVQKYVSGFAFHWYTSGVMAPYDDLLKVTTPIKDKIEFVLMTEACTGSNPADRGVTLGSWERGESYASDIIEDLLRGTNGWVDWNLALDLNGGPNWANNFVDSPIIVDKTAKEFYKQPMYYALGHFSRLFRPGSVRVDAKIRGAPELKVVSVYKNDTGHVILNILNTSNKFFKTDVEVGSLDGSTVHIGEITVDARSITSVVSKI